MAAKLLKRKCGSVGSGRVASPIYKQVSLAGRLIAGRLIKTLHTYNPQPMFLPSINFLHLMVSEI